MEIIHNFSIQNLTNFFRAKLFTFKPQMDYLSDMLSDNFLNNFTDLYKIGEAQIDNNNELLVITAKSINQLTSRSGKKMQFDIAKKILKNEYKDAAFFVFYDNNGNFRFSFIRANYLGTKRDFTDYKRYTYYVSQEQTNKTFISQIEKADFSNLESIQEAFSVEPLNKLFYQKISHHFYTLIGGKISAGKNTTEYQAQMKLPSVSIENNRKTYQEFAVRLIGRTIFVWFLKNKISENHLPLIPANWLTPERVLQNPNYYHSLLEKLFFEILNKKIEARDADLPEEHKTIPFLNGGLFEPNTDDFYYPNSQNQKINFALKIPDEWFLEFFETLQQFNFTIDENSIHDTEVSIDPEMLGTIFENLLAEIDPDTEKSARKSTGSFYTPREIVDYMVEESLVSYLKTKTNNSEESLHNLFKENQLSVNDFENPLKIIDAFDEIKILDPACGSGAFPMGALHKINMALQKLDPTAEIYKNKQLDGIEDDFVKEVLKKKFTKSNAEYIRKLGIVKKSIYGIDIQPIATEISKLRCFLSLVVDETIIDTEDNRNIYTLPNLEFKFVTANTLIDLENNETQGTLDFGQTNEDLENLQKIRDKYLNQSNNHKKSFLKEKFVELQNQIANKEFKSIGAGENRKAQQIIGWKPFTHEKSDWFNPKWMFGVEKFDVVIGNPPYIQLQKAVNSEIKLADLYKTQNYKTFERTGDIYALFYEKAAEILAQNGLLCFITSNKWMRANYGKSLRKYFANKNPLKLIDMGPGVFNSATVDTNILLLQNSTNQNQLLALSFTKKHNIQNLSKTDFITLQTPNEDSWIILSDAEFRIKQKIEKIGTPLKEWDINIYRGILTGYNKAFIIDGKTKDDLIAADAKNAEIIKPILRGRDIKRYKAEFADLWLIATHNGYKDENGNKIPPIDIENYPTIKEYLDQFYPQLEKRQDKGKTPYNLRNCAYHKEFEKEKIVWQRITQEPTFCISERKQLILDSMAFISSFENSFGKYLISILNSKTIKYWVYRNVHQYGNTGFRLSNQYVEQIPIPVISEAEQKPFEEKVEEIIRLKELGEDTAKLEAEIDKMVYKLYNLSDEEIKIIEGV